MCAARARLCPATARNAGCRIYRCDTAQKSAAVSVASSIVFSLLAERRPAGRCRNKTSDTAACCCAADRRLPGRAICRQRCSRRGGILIGLAGNRGFASTTPGPGVFESASAIVPRSACLCDGISDFKQRDRFVPPLSPRSCSDSPGPWPECIGARPCKSGSAKVDLAVSAIGCAQQ